MPAQLALQPTDRATPPCPHFGECGGCQLQHLTYRAQLDLKAAQLRALLRPTGLVWPDFHVHQSPPFAYRNRIRLTLTTIEGELKAGYIRADHSDSEASLLSILPIRECPIAAPILWRAAEAFLALVNQDRATWLGNPQQTLDQLELFTSPEEGPTAARLQFTLYLRSSAKTLPAKLATAFTTLCEALRARVPELAGAGISLLPMASTQRSRRGETSRPGPAWGSPGLNYRVGDTDYWVPRGAFFQINRFLLPELHFLVTAGCSGILAWDLYAGVGLFSKALARNYVSVTAVEIAEPAFTALAATKLSNLHAVKATTLDFLRSAVLQRDRPELIVLDPPRTGAGPEICALLARIAAPTLIYVSCSPQHLAADLIPLTASGYTLAELHILDLFPQTTHFETVAILSR